MIRGRLRPLPKPPWGRGFLLRERFPALTGLQGIVRSRELHRNLFDNFDIEAFERCYSSGVIGQEADSFQIQVGKNLRSQADFTMDSALVLGHRGQTTLAMKCQEGLLADF